MPLDYAISALLTLLVVVDPVGLVPTFLAVTEDLPRQARRSVAVRSSIIAGAILIGTALIGDWLLHTLSISLPAFRIAGGLLLFSIASEMVFGVRLRRESREAEEALEEHVRNIAAFPLAIPLLGRPGRDHRHRAVGRTRRRQSDADRGPDRRRSHWSRPRVSQPFCLPSGSAAFIGLTGNIVLSRLLGVLLAALAVQYVVDGVRAVLGG